MARAGIEKYVGDTAYEAVVEPFLRLRADARTTGRATDAAVLAEAYLEAAAARRPLREPLPQPLTSMRARLVTTVRIVARRRSTGTWFHDRRHV